MKIVEGAYTRQISFTPAYDYRHEKPNRGQHNMQLAFVLLGSKGALIFDISTSWMVDRVNQTPWTHPKVWGICAHRYIDSDPHSDCIEDHCGWLGGEPCVPENLFGFTSPIFEELLSVFISEGEEALWKRLEIMYAEKM